MKPRNEIFKNLVYWPVLSHYWLIDSYKLLVYEFSESLDRYFSSTYLRTNLSTVEFCILDLALVCFESVTRLNWNHMPELTRIQNGKNHDYFSVSAKSFGNFAESQSYCFICPFTPSPFVCLKIYLLQIQCYLSFLQVHIFVYIYFLQFYWIYFVIF